MKLLLVHGRAQGGKDAAVLEKLWTDFLRQGFQSTGNPWPDAVEVAFPFYGDLLDELIDKLSGPLPAGVLERGVGDGSDMAELEFKFALLSELAAAEGITDDDVQAEIGPEVVERGPQNWKWVRALARVIDRSRHGGALINKITHDVYIYLTKPAVRRKIDAVVAEKLTPGSWVVVAHSMGTIVAYNVLRNPPPGVEVKGFLTVGSPLGLKTIRNKLDVPLAHPTCVKEWENARDPRDIVALYPLAGDHFPIAPGIGNYDGVKNTYADCHGIEGYLEDRHVAAQVARFFG